MPQVQKPLCLINFWMIPFSHFPLSGVIGNGSSQYKDQDDGKIRLTQRLQAAEDNLQRDGRQDDV